MDTPDPEGTFQALEKYGTDLTALAREGKLDPVIGRDSESAAWCRCSHGAPRITPCSLVNPASAKPLWSKGWRSAWSPATSPNPCAVKP